MHLYGDSASNKPANNYDVELVATSSESAGNYCKHGLATGEYTYTHVWQPTTVDLAQYRHANRILPTELPTSVRHCRRNHDYESPSFDEHGMVETPGPLVFPPYYFHEPAARLPRQPEGNESRRAAVSSDEHHHHHHQQQQQPTGQVGQVSVSENNGSASAASTVGAGEWYQPCCTTRYQPVICRTSSSDPDVTLRPQTENHYT